MEGWTNFMKKVRYISWCEHYPLFLCFVIGLVILVSPNPFTFYVGFSIYMVYIERGKTIDEWLKWNRVWLAVKSFPPGFSSDFLPLSFFSSSSFHSFCNSNHIHLPFLFCFCTAPLCLFSCYKSNYLLETQSLQHQIWHYS